MKIGELSQVTGVSIRMLRYYEEQGLIRSERQSNGYRVFNPTVPEQVRTIKFYIELGLTTEQISGFLHCVMRNKESFCREIMPVYTQKLLEINEQIAMLTRIKSNLEERMTAILEDDPNPKEK
ncbi:MerR family transcriptional regulator [Paenibacillus swuensis]|uniref:MerR family transcriptional regulator n=1 Tax=Paenibacillus swuensis TaxID=1178515 RepID=A0A172TP14_9BACL|nr:MerR family transcriptional regulator [Paenibacillus swuensis]ANE48716.1 MerR family transcriptional regulator [Paenibacillus swuensis]